jgi:glutathione synthase/RimK-type ligase-like ATP-grasp enzyme
VNGWIVIADQDAPLPAAARAHPVMTPRAYIAATGGFTARRLKVLNLARSQGYQELGYYCSLLAEARGHKVLPAVATMLELRRRSGYGHALPELEEALNRTVHRLADPPQGSFRLLIYLGQPEDARFERFARQVFDWFRAPVLELALQAGEWWRIRRIAPVGVDELSAEGLAHFDRAVDAYTRRGWRAPRARTSPRYTLAVLHDAKDPLPPSSRETLLRLERIAEPMGLGVELIGKADFDRVAEYDALWIRETTRIDHHTYRFARRAELEGMPVIDDPTSIVRCTNKVYLAELLRANRVPIPRSMVVGGVRELDRVEAEFGFPVVLKIPDGSFSLGVRKADGREQLQALTRQMLNESDLILAQMFMPTPYDWRVGVLDGEPLYVCQYMMARRHWQILHHRENGRPEEGPFRSFALDEAPREVIDTAVRAARLIGRGLYGVDLKQTEDGGVFVIEINDNPNMEHGIEDAALKDELWRRLLNWFLKRLA